MPIFDINCPNCGQINDIWAKIDDMHPACPQCGHATVRLISPVRLQLDIEPYFDENLADARKCPNGQWVKSRQHKRQLLKDMDLAEVG